MWQFQIVRIAPHLTPEEATQLLQAQAEQGWEIVTVLPAPSTHASVGHWVYLRRPPPVRKVVLPPEADQEPELDPQPE